MQKTHVRLQSQMKRCKSLKSIKFNGLSPNSNLMNINFGQLHY